MSAILWMCTLSVVLVRIQSQSMNAYAVVEVQKSDSPQSDNSNATKLGIVYGDSVQSNETNTTIPTCKPLETPPGAIKKNRPCNNTYGSKCVFTCSVGMKREEGQARDVTRTCSQSGRWSGNSINCKAEGRPPLTSHHASGKILLPITVVLGSLLLITLIVVAIFCLLVRTRLKSNARTRSFDTEAIIGQDNLAYRQPRSPPDDELEMKVMVPQHSDVGFSKPHIYPGGHCETLDNANGRPDNFYPDILDSTGAVGTQSEIENELNTLDSPNCSNGALRNRPPTSFPESITKLEATLFSTGGEFSAQGCSNWESAPKESERVTQFQAVFAVKEDSTGSKSSRKRATVYASRPDPGSDLIYLRFYVYSDTEDSKMRVKLAEEERFPGSRPAREKPFRMHKHSREFTVRLTELEDGWNSDKLDDTQIYRYMEIDACDFAVKPEDGRDVNGFNCSVKFQQEGDDEEHSFYLNPGFTPLKRQSIRRNSAEGGRCESTTSTAQYECFVDWDEYPSSLGSEPVTEEHIYRISPDVGRYWKDLLRSLSIKEKVVENLSVDLMRETITEQCIQALIKWKNRDPQLATVKTLAVALRDVRCFDALRTLQKLR